MSIPTIERPTLGTQIGGNLGRTLAEQIPQEIGRQRLAYALKNLQGKDYEPLQQFQYLTSVGGASPEQAAQFLPFFQQAQQRKILEQQAGGNVPPAPGVAPTVTTKAAAPVRKKVAATAGAVPEGFGTDEQIQEMKQARAQAVTPQMIAQRALQLPGTPDMARSAAEQELKGNLAAQEKQIHDVQEEIDTRYGDIFQSPSIKDYGSQLPGRTKKYFKDQGEYLMRNGMSSQAAAKTVGDGMQELGDALLRANVNASKFTLTSGSKEKMQGILPEREIAQKYGQTDQFDKIVINSLGVSPSTYFSRVSPIEGDKLKNEIKKSVSQRDPLGYFKKHVIPRIGPNDNPQSVIAEFQKSVSKKGVTKLSLQDPTPFLNAMRDADKKGLLHLNEENRKILESFTTGTPNLSDLWFEVR